MEKVPGKGVAGGIEVVKGNVDPEIKPSYAPENWGTEGSTVEEDRNDPALDRRWTEEMLLKEYLTWLKPRPLLTIR